MESRNDRVARMFDAALEHPRAWIVLVFVGVAAAIVAGLTTHWARPSQSAWAYGIYMGLLALTLLAILWYLTAGFSTMPCAKSSTSPRWISCQGVWCAG